jgi:hypothetical protein
VRKSGPGFPRRTIRFSQKGASDWRFDSAGFAEQEAVARMARGSIMESAADTLIGNVDEMALMLTGWREYSNARRTGYHA